MPDLEFNLLNYTWSMNVFIPAVGAMTLLFTVLGVWPFVEKWMTGDNKEHHLLERPRNAPTRTALGVAGMTAYAVLWMAGGNDIIATRLHLDIFMITRTLQIGFFILPVIAYHVTKRICIGLQRQDANRILHGYETGVIERTPDGAFSERHAPLDPVHQYALTTHERLPELTAPAETDKNGVAAPHGRKAKVQAWVRKRYYHGVLDKPTVEDVHHANEHLGEIDGHPVELGDEFQGVSETGIPRVH